MDSMYKQRYVSYRSFFNCTDLPETANDENKALTQLIDKCLMKTDIDDLFLFNFGLIDAPGPVYDGFLGEESLINTQTIKEMAQRSHDENNIDILTGVNSLEGFSFEGHFSSSVKYWKKKNLTTEVMLTFERYSLLLRDRCKQNSLIAKRMKLEKFYIDRVTQVVKDPKYMDKEKIQRMKAIFANSDAIFDSGFIDFVNTIYDLSVSSNERSGSLYVYEYLHENQASQPNLQPFKKYLNNDLSMSTHFDGIDLSFGKNFFIFIQDCA